MEETLTHIAKWKKPGLKGLHTVRVQRYDILEKAKQWRHKKNQWFPGFQKGMEGKMNRWSLDSFQGRATTLHIITVDTCQTFVQTHRMYNTKGEL